MPVIIPASWMAYHHNMNYFSISVLFACGLMGILIGLYAGLSIQNLFYYRERKKKKKRDDKEAKQLYPGCDRSSGRKTRSVEYLAKRAEKNRKKEERLEKKLIKKEKKELEIEALPDKTDHPEIPLTEIPSAKQELFEKQESDDNKEADIPFEETEDTVFKEGYDESGNVEETCGCEEESVAEEKVNKKDPFGGENTGEALVWFLGRFKKIPSFFKEKFLKKEEPSSVLSRLDNEEEGYISERCSDCGEDVNDVLSKSMGSQDEAYNIIQRKNREN